MTETEKKIDAMFERLVPRTGKSGTVAGEIVRAVSRIGYRYWNDGDHLGIGYGREVCNPAGSTWVNFPRTGGGDPLIKHYSCGIS